MIRQISPHLKEQIANEKILREWRAVIANYQCEDCKDKYLDFRGHCLVHLKNKGMGGTRHIYTIDEVRYKCYHCHNVNNHHLREGNGKEESQTQPSSKN